jgi:sugar phosphate isomerase/epimerase
MTYSRREFGKMALGSITVASAVLSNPSLFAADKPDSKFGGVQIGIIIPYSYHNMPSDGPWLLNAMVRDGINLCESHSEPIEQWAGSPMPAARGGAARGAGRGAAAPEAGGAPAAGGYGAARGGRAPLTPEQVAAQKAAADAMTKWRLSVPMSKYVEYRKMYNDAGVTIYVFKQSITMNMPDEECDYIFTAAKTLGATVLSMEMPTSGEVTQRVGEFASKHKMMVGYHAHLQATPTLWDEAMSQSPYNGINLDIGHYTAGGNRDAVAFLEKHHDRITHVHFKDRKFPENGGQNVPWGQGDTPIIAALQLMKKEKYKFPGIIELEYTVPDGSDSEKEIVKCLAYAKAALA